jgi:hypothetical protein
LLDQFVYIIYRSHLGITSIFGTLSSDRCREAASHPLLSLSTMRNEIPR